MEQRRQLTCPKRVERWGVWEMSMKGPSGGNPFTEQHVDAEFTCASEHVTVSGFYDGDGVYRVRFMPSFEGKYTWRVEGTFADAPAEGRFLATAPSEGNHGPVRVANT